MQHLCVFITTYDRPGMLRRLLVQVNHYSENYKVHLIIVRDYCEKDYSECFQYVRDNFDSWHWQSLPEHKGKKNFHEVINAGLDIMQGYDFNVDYFFKLDDDQLLEPNFFAEAIDRYKKIMDPRKIALTLINDGRKRGWTGIPREPYQSAGHNYYRSQWVDGAFMGTPRFWRAFRYKIRETPRDWWDGNERRGSGVYRTISKKLVSYNLAIYQVRSSLVYHGYHRSKMNPKNHRSHRIISRYE